MGTEEKIGVVADRLADAGTESLAEFEVVERGLSTIVDRVRAGGVELDGGETLAHVLRGPLGRAFRIGVKVVALVRRGVEVGVGTKSLPHPPSEQCVYGLADFLAEDVPAGHLQPAQHRSQRDVGPQRVATAVHAPHEILDPARVTPGQVALRSVLDHFLDDVGAEGGAVDFAEALDSRIGHEFHEEKVAPAKAGRRVPDHEGLDVADLHLLSPSSLSSNTITLRIA